MSPPPITPNVLLVVLDDIGVEWFDFYGIGAEFTTDPEFRYARTPTLAKLAADGLLFRQGYAHPVCGPTRASIQTGRHPFRTGFGQNIVAPDLPRTIGHALNDRFTWLPEAIVRARPDVQCGAVGKWHLCDGYSQVVDPRDVAPDAHLDHARRNGYRFSAVHVPNYGGLPPWFRVLNGAVDPPNGYRGTFGREIWLPHVHVKDSLRWIGAQHGPWFLYLAFNAPHDPFTIPPYDALGDETVAELEDAGIEQGDALLTLTTYDESKLHFRAGMEGVDTALGELLAGMRPSVRDNTVVLVCGDNGTVFSALPTGFVHAKRSALAGGTRVPMIAHGRQVTAHGATDELAHAVDLYATVLDLFGAPMPVEAMDFDTLSLLPVLTGRPGLRTRVLTETFSPWGATDPAQQIGAQRALYDGRWRYLAQSGEQKLFDFPEDPLEVQDVAADHPDIVQRMASELAEIVGN